MIFKKNLLYVQNRIQDEDFGPLQNSVFRIRIPIKLKGRIRIRIKVISWSGSASASKWSAGSASASISRWQAKMNGIWAYLNTFSRFWAFIWKLGSRTVSGAASKWKVGSGSASKWQAGSGSATMLSCYGCGFPVRCMHVDQEFLPGWLDWRETKKLNNWVKKFRNKQFEIVLFSWYCG